MEFPAGVQADRALRNATSLSRLITRLIFVWFLKEKGLVPADLFNPQRLHAILTSLADDESSYYQAILQNLFFATLNQEMNTPQRPASRKFRGEGRQHYNITTLYRHQARFRDPEAALALFASIPFLKAGCAMPAMRAGRPRTRCGRDARAPSRTLALARIAPRLQSRQSRGTLVTQCLTGVWGQSPQSNACSTAPPRGKPTIGLDKVCRYMTVLADVPRPVAAKLYVAHQKLQPCLRG